MKRLLIVVGVLLAIVVAGVGVALWQLDAILTERAQLAAADASKTLGRPVTLGGISTSLFPPLSVQIRSASIGAAEGESQPLLSLENVSVRVDAMAALRSKGKDLQVLDAELRGLTVNVIRFKDGTTNLERLTEKLDAEKKAEEPAKDEAATDLSGLVVHRAALVDGRFALLDQATPGAKELAISDVDVEVLDLRAGQPLNVVLKAAVLGAAQNFELQVKTTPLSPTLEALPQLVSLQAKGLDLGPLGPFLGSEVGLRAGTLDADWKVSPGALVPGGSGPSEIRGKVSAKGLRFDAAEKGKPLDALIETDVTFDSVEGAAQIRALQVLLGPAQLLGKGRLAKLWSSAPEMDGFEVTLKELDLDALTAYYPPLKQQLGQQLGGVVSLLVRGSGAAAHQSLVADLNLTGARLNVPEQLTKAAGQTLVVHAEVTGAAAAQALRFDARADLTGVDLRPGKSLNKAPGQPLTLQTKGRYQGGASTKVSLEQLTVKMLEDTLVGSAGVELGGGGNPNAVAFHFDGKAKRLDADKLLLPSDEKAAAAKPAPGSPPAKNDPKQYDGMKGDVSLAVAALRYGGEDYEDVLLKLAMVNDRLTLQKMSVRAYGGRVALDGSEFQLGPERMPYDLKLKIEGVDVASAIRKRLPKDVLSGRLTGDFTFAGAGFTAADLAETLSGAMKGNIDSGAFVGLDLVGAVSNALTKELPFVQKAAPAKSLSLGKMMPFGMHVEKGVALLDKPLAFEDTQALISTTGGFKLNGDLALEGIAALKPETVLSLTKGKVKLDSPLPIPFKVVGPAWSPRIEGIDVKPAVKLLAEKAGRAALSEALGGKDKEAEQKARAVASQAQADLERRKEEERAKAEAAAKAEAKKRKAQAADEAKKKLRGFLK